MEKENDRARSEARRALSETVRTLVTFVKRRDWRVKGHLTLSPSLSLSPNPSLSPSLSPNPSKSPSLSPSLSPSPSLSLALFLTQPQAQQAREGPCSVDGGGGEYQGRAGACREAGRFGRGTRGAAARRGGSVDVKPDPNPSPTPAYPGLASPRLASPGGGGGRGRAGGAVARVR